MRNLKKILALVLALIMSLSLMATAGASQFPDVDESNPYATAIDVLDELKVFQGFDDGTFKPTETLNRAQAAVLVYRIATGDVENKYLDNYTYMAQSRFTDLEGYNWAKGYINYCQNAGIVVGTSATTFDPGAKVTGYQLLVMLLRTLGYGKAGEFADPKGWELQTATIAEREGITKNVTGGDFENPAPRQMVAEILFRGLLQETVEYSALVPGGYTKGQTLGMREFGLEEISGVITANEYADLYGATPLKEGKTRLVNDDKTYNLDYATELTDIGENHHAYITNGAKVLSMEKAGNTVWENGGKKATVKDGLKEAGLTRGGESYINFGGDGDTYKSDIRIAYMFSSIYKTYGSDWTKDDAIENLTNELKTVYGITVKTGEVTADGVDDDGNWDHEVKFARKGGIKESFAPGESITQEDMNCIRDIFYYADRLKEDDGGVVVLGEVYVGTKSTEDISDDPKVTYKSFCADYIQDVSDYADVTSADNGEWLKVIDNDGDGVADYVFLTTFVMTTVVEDNTRLNRYTVEYTNEQAAGKKVDRNSKGEVVAPSTRLVIDKDDISTDIETIAEGDVILYTLIDGVYYVSAPTVETVAIDKKGIDYKAETFTCGDKTYEWSGIDYEAYYYYHDVSEAKTETNYDFYLDHFGYIRLYIESTYNNGFVLLTDGYFETDRRTDGYKAQIWNREAEDYEDVVVLGGSGATAASTFIDNEYDKGANGREEGTWKRLKSAEEVYAPVNSDFVTNVAAYSVNDDGEYTLMKVQDASNSTKYNAYELNLDKDGKGTVISPKERTIYTIDNPAVRVQTTNDTVYYYVLNPGTSSEKITSWVGYSNAPSSVTLSLKSGYVDRAYAVTTPANTDAAYDTAEVVVFEAYGWTQTAVLAYALDQKMIGEERTFDLYGMGVNEDGKYGPTVVSAKVTKQNRNQVLSMAEYADYAPWNLDHLIRFYTVDSKGNTYDLYSDNYTKDQPGVYEDYGVYAGYVTTAERVQNRDYITMSKDGTKTSTSHSFFPDSTPTYVVTFNPDAAAQVESVWVDALNGDTSATREDRTGNVRTTYDVEENDAFSAGRVSPLREADKVIYVVNGSGSVLYAINVTESKYYNKDAKDYVQITALEELWDEIVADYAASKVPGTGNAPVVTFFGVKDGDAKDSAGTVGTPNGAITVSYKDAKDQTGLVIDNCTDYELKNSKGEKITVDDVKLNAEGASYTLNVYGDDKSFTSYKLVQAKAGKTAVLSAADTTNHFSGGNTLVIANSADESIDTWIKNFSVSNNGTVKWTFLPKTATTAAEAFKINGLAVGDQVIPNNYDIGDIGEAMVEVYAENGKLVATYFTSAKTILGPSNPLKTGSVTLPADGVSENVRAYYDAECTEVAINAGNSATTFPAGTTLYFKAADSAADYRGNFTADAGTVRNIAGNYSPVVPSGNRYTVSDAYVVEADVTATIAFVENAKVTFTSTNGNNTVTASKLADGQSVTSGQDYYVDNSGNITFVLTTDASTGYELRITTDVASPAKSTLTKVNNTMWNLAITGVTTGKTIVINDDRDADGIAAAEWLAKAKAILDKFTFDVANSDPTKANDAAIVAAANKALVDGGVPADKVVASKAAGSTVNDADVGAVKTASDWQFTLTEKITGNDGTETTVATLKVRYEHLYTLTALKADLEDNAKGIKDNYEYAATTTDGKVSTLAELEAAIKADISKIGNVQIVDGTWSVRENTAAVSGVFASGNKYDVTCTVSYAGETVEISKTVSITT